MVTIRIDEGSEKERLPDCHLDVWSKVLQFDRQFRPPWGDYKTCYRRDPMENESSGRKSGGESHCQEHQCSVQELAAYYAS